MKRKVLTAIITFLLTGAVVTAQRSVSLAECIQAAAGMHRLSGEPGRYSVIGELTAKNLKSSRLPTADAGAGIVYNSDIPDLRETLAGIPVPGLADLIPEVPHTQYRLTLELSQLIYDGGIVKEMRRVNEANTLVNRQLAEIELYSSAERVIACYYSILLLDRYNELLAGFMTSADARLAAVRSAISAGVLTEPDYDMIYAGRLTLSGKAADNRNLARSLREILSGMTGIAFDDSTELLTEKDDWYAPEEIGTGDLLRPELKLFDLTAGQLEAGEKLTVALRKPKVYGFATLGYGNPPGNNFFRDAFEPYFVTGASVRWNIYDWNRSKREREILKVKREITGSRRSDAEEKLLRMIAAKLTEIENLENAIATGEELVILRRRISLSASSKFENGTITAAEFISITAGEQEAVTELEIRKVNLMKARSEYLYMCGMEII